MSLGDLVPRECRGWLAAAQDSDYTQEGIYKYMDGAGELYREYDYRELFVRKLLKAGQPAVTVELFDMGTPGRAFGVFAHTRDGPEAGVGQGSEYRAGLLCFWKGRFFACVRAEHETAEAKRAVMDTGHAIAAAIKQTGPLPALLDLLPKQDLIEQNVRYFFKHTCLNYHYFIADDNILKLGKDTEAVLAPYRQPGGRHYLLLIKYPTTEAANAALESFLHAYLPDAKTSGIARTENGKWTGATMRGDMIIILLDAISRERAEEMMNGVATSLVGPR